MCWYVQGKGVKLSILQVGPLLSTPVNLLICMRRPNSCQNILRKPVSRHRMCHCYLSYSVDIELTVVVVDLELTAVVVDLQEAAKRTGTTA